MIIVKYPLILLSMLPLVLGAQAQLANVSTVTPNGDLTTGRTYVHIHGTRLYGALLLCPLETCGTFVKFDGSLGTIVDNTNDEIVVLTPPHPAGTVDVVINVPGGGPPITIPAGFRYQEPIAEDRVRLLVPVAISVSGALGSSWKAEVSLVNENVALVTVTGAVAAPVDVAAGTGVALALTPPAGSVGAFLYIPRRLAHNVSVALRVHDTSRDADGWGADIPIVPETQFRDSVTLTAVPADARFRTLLRVYGYGAATRRVQVALRDDATGMLLASQPLDLVPALTADSRNTPLAPSYAQLSLDPLVAAFAAEHSRIRVTVTDTWPEPEPLWAFVSITNNVTQQVTTVMPASTEPNTGAAIVGP